MQAARALGPRGWLRCCSGAVARPVGIAPSRPTGDSLTRRGRQPTTTASAMTARIGGGGAQAFQPHSETRGIHTCSLGYRIPATWISALADDSSNPTSMLQTPGAVHCPHPRL